MTLSDELDPIEWLERTKHDLGTAELLLKQSDYYDVVIYHSHQCVEKILKWYLINQNIQFPFIHDIVRLLVLCSATMDVETLKDDVSALQEFSPRTRYPYGDSLALEDAKQSLDIARRIYRLFVGEIKPTT